MRFENILVPLDGTAIGRAALPYAEAIATRTGARQALMRAAHAPLGSIDRTAAQPEVIATAHADLEAAAQRLAGRGLKAETAVPYGSAWIPEKPAPCYGADPVPARA